MKLKTVVGVSLMMFVFALCQTVRADLGTQLDFAYPGNSVNGTNAWENDPGNNPPFYTSANLNVPLSDIEASGANWNYFTAAGPTPISAQNNADATVEGEVVTITNGDGVLSTNEYGVITGQLIDNTNYCLTGLSFLVDGARDLNHPYTLHIFDITTNYTGTLPVISGYNFVSNGDLLAGGTNGIIFTNSANFVATNNPLFNNNSGNGPQCQQLYLGLSNGVYSDQIILGAGHTYALEIWFPRGYANSSAFAEKTSATAGYTHPMDNGGTLMVSADSQLNVARETGSAAGFYGGSQHNWAVALYGFPTNAAPSFNTSTNYPPNPISPPPIMGIQAANVPELRIFAAPTAGSTSDRTELATLDESQSWVGQSGPVSYSITLLDYPNPENIQQTHILLVPTAFAGQANLGNEYTPGQPPTPNENIDYQATNGMWLTIFPNGTNGFTGTVSWKTNQPNSNPYQTGVVALVITNSTIVGTWTLTFNSASTGTLTAPGASPVPFTINDPTASTDFANPMIAYFGLEPNGTLGEGQYEDWGGISVSGVAGINENENFTTESSDNIYASGFWQVNSASATAAETGVEIVSTNDFPAYWVNWTLPAANYLIAENTNLMSHTWINPAYYSAYNSAFETAPIGAAAQEGTKMWVYLPWQTLPTKDGGQNEPVTSVSTNAWFLATPNQVSP
jgi:hypothetical protein